MTFRNRQGQESEDKFHELERTLSLDNLSATEILTDFPAATQQTGIFIVESGGTFYLQINGKGERHRVALTSF